MQPSPSPRRKKADRDFNAFEHALPHDEVDGKLFPGAFEQGWVVVPRGKHGGKHGNWLYVSPMGEACKTRAAVMAVLPDGGAEKEAMYRHRLDFNGSRDFKIISLDEKVIEKETKDRAAAFAAAMCPCSPWALGSQLAAAPRVPLLTTAQACHRTHPILSLQSDPS